MKNNLLKYKRKAWVFALLLSVLVFTGVEAATIDQQHFSYQTAHSEEYEDKVQIVEAYLQKQVPGLGITYRDVFDILIEEGQDLYIKGGLIRDLLSPNPQTPHDVDFVFSGTKEEILEIVHKHQWQHTTQPDYSLITIGDHKKICMEGVSKGGFLPTNENQLEFTINNIYYHINSRSFVTDVKGNFEDLDYSRLRILAKDWKEWLYGSHGRYRYAKLFRVWKMIGKGYIYRIEFESFIKQETHDAQKNDAALFHEELLTYLSNHYESFDDIAHGVFSVMGREWLEEFLLPIREEAEVKSQAVIEKMDEFTYFN